MFWDLSVDEHFRRFRH